MKIISTKEFEKEYLEIFKNRPNIQEKVQNIYDYLEKMVLIKIFLILLI